MPSSTMRHDNEAARKLDIAQAAAQGLDVSDVPSASRCKYPSKFCGNARAPKIDGQLHRFCEFHRHRANNNQKRWTSVRRRLARESREFQKQQDALRVNTAWAHFPGHYNYDAAMLSSPTCSENFPSFDYAYGAICTSSVPPMLLPTKPSVAPPLNDVEVHILTTLLAPPTGFYYATERGIDAMGVAAGSPPVPPSTFAWPTAESDSFTTPAFAEVDTSSLYV